MTDLPRPRLPNGVEFTATASPRALWAEIARRAPVVADLVPALVLTVFLVAASTAQQRATGDAAPDWGRRLPAARGRSDGVGAAATMATARVCRLARLHGRLPSHRRSTGSNSAGPISRAARRAGRDTIAAACGSCRRSVAPPCCPQSMVLCTDGRGRWRSLPASGCASPWWRGSLLTRDGAFSGNRGRGQSGRSAAAKRKRAGGWWRRGCGSLARCTTSSDTAWRSSACRPASRSISSRAGPTRRAKQSRPSAA